MLNTDQNFSRGVSAYKNGNYREAEQLFKQVLELEPFSPEVLLNLGNVYFKLNDMARAEENWTKAIEVNPVEEKAYLNLGNLYFSRQCYSKAIAYWQIFSKLNPSHGIVHYNLGLAYEALKQMKEAYEHFTTFMHLSARSQEAIDLRKRLKEVEPVAMHNLIQAERFLNAGQLEHARRAYEQSLFIFPADTKYYKHYASVLYHLGDMKEATHWYEYVFHLNPDDSGVLVNLGVLYDKQNQNFDAAWAYFKVIQLCGNKTPLKVQKRYRKLWNEMGSNALANLLKKANEMIRHGEFEEAEAFLQRLLDLARENASNLVPEVNSLMNQLDERRDPVHKAAKIAFAIAEDFKDSGQYEKALPFYKRYLELMPNGDKAPVARERIEHVEKTITAVIGDFLGNKATSTLAG